MNAVKPLLIFVSLFICCCNWCCASPMLSEPEEMYKTTLNLDVPAEISNFKGKGAVYFLPLPSFMSSGYFEYKAKPSYFEMLQQHHNFPNSHPTNRPIQKVECGKVSYALSGTFYTDYIDEPLDYEHKICYWGVFAPFEHSIIYNPATGQVQPFFNGLRD